jgi:hypothetical protein
MYSFAARNPRNVLCRSNRCFLATVQIFQRLTLLYEANLVNRKRGDSTTRTTIKATQKTGTTELQDPLTRNTGIYPFDASQQIKALEIWRWIPRIDLENGRAVVIVVAFLQQLLGAEYQPKTKYQMDHIWLRRKYARYLN